MHKYGHFAAMYFGTGHLDRKEHLDRKGHLDRKRILGRKMTLLHEVA